MSKAQDASVPCTVVVLNRGGRYYRSAVFQNLENAGFSSVISVEMNSESYDIENLITRFPSIRFLIPQGSTTIGEMINTAVAETNSPWVFVVWNDIEIAPHSLSERLFDRLNNDPVFCTAPVLSTEKMEALPVQMVPALNRNSFQIEPMYFFRDGSPTVYPFDFTGIYNRERFIRLGGYDYTITNPYWQNLDFGFRAYLWGEKIQLSSIFKLAYGGEIPTEDATTDTSYIQFYLKNLAPVYRKNRITLPLSCFFSYAVRSGLNIIDAVLYFREARKWIALNNSRFVRDAVTLCGSWEPSLQ
ncbi:hypothetical protein K7I13_02085 [Brucepastera parasyntrophica]|uniref:hypothetical protein n=1 Tax=Brucepastera parasyntrophica TaxID=2880008 RepID=UPI00210E7FEC|nr:hypothetical protein [Brucepastera parasyntrophica]ULQ60134.1 hypothetical protein K7I13_02085 [Brucepastera parasyntrophica]